MADVTLPPPSDGSSDETKVLRSFIRNGRLATIPARGRKRLIVLRFLLDQALPDELPVEERVLNARLASWHPDVAALRRYLVDSGLATRDRMVYRRAPAPAPRDDLRDGEPPVV